MEFKLGPFVRFNMLFFIDPKCQYHGKDLREGETVRENCNECKCEVRKELFSIIHHVLRKLMQVSVSRPGCMEVLCSGHQCALDQAVEEKLRKSSR